MKTVPLFAGGIAGQDDSGMIAAHTPRRFAHHFFDNPVSKHPAKYLNHFTLSEIEDFNAQSDIGVSQVFRSML